MAINARCAYFGGTSIIVLWTMQFKAKKCRTRRCKGRGQVRAIELNVLFLSTVTVVEMAFRTSNWGDDRGVVPTCFARVTLQSPY